MDDAIQQSVDNCQSLLESLQVPLLVLDEYAEVLYSNSAASELRDLEHLAQTSVADLCVAEIAALQRDGKPRRFERLLVADHRNHYYEFMLSPLAGSCSDSPRYLLSAVDFSRQYSLEGSLREMVQGIADTTGEAFLKFLVLHLARATDADYAFICEFTDETRRRVRTVAVCADGQIIPNLEFDLINTPCDLVVAQGMKCYTDRLLEHFPLDHLAIKMRVESYIGVPLRNSEGKVLGPLAIFSRRPLENASLAQSMLQIFASRAAAELERKKAQDELRSAEERLKTIVEFVQAGIVVIDAETHRIVDANSLAVEMLGKPREEILDHVCHQHICPAFHGECPVMDKGLEVYNSEQNLLGPDGKRVPVIKTVTRIDLNGRPHLVESFIDISARKKAENALRESEERYRLLVENQNDLICKIDLDGNILFASPSLSEYFERSEQELLGHSLVELVEPRDRNELQQLFTRVQQEPFSGYYESRVHTPKGVRWVGWALKAVLNQSDQLSSMVGIGRDITDRKQAEMEVEQLAYYDSLTGLPNRLLFQNRLAEALTESACAGEQLGVIFLDIDRFKTINDSLGHSTGDQFLEIIARRITTALGECGTVARLGGDEFVIFIPRLHCEQGIATMAQEICKRLAQPVFLARQTLYSSASLGIAMFPEDGHSVEVLLKNADIAMYQAKELGRNNFQFFSAEMNSRAQEQVQMEQALRSALEYGEFFLTYQPQVDLGTNELIGVEALLRWNHPEHGVLAPDRFIPLAEETRLILPIGEWVLHEACRQNMEWQAQGLPPMRMAVNISAQQFRLHDLAEVVRQALAATGMDARYLELELTESTIMDHSSSTIAMLRSLKQMGVYLSIDDFGTGYSSLSYLKHFPIDRLKIDRSFIRDIIADRDDAAITEAVIAMAQRLELRVLAEGVECTDQLDFLRDRQCNEIQGYYLSRPQRASEIGQLLRLQPWNSKRG